MGSYKWSYKSLIQVVIIPIATLLATLVIPTHEPPSRGSMDFGVQGLGLGFRGIWGSDVSALGV